MNILEVQGLHKKYDTVHAVKGVNFSIQKGEFVALLGPNGAGKSTTINILCTLLKPTSGEVSYQGNLIGKHDDEIRKKIGIVFQDNVMDNKLTVKENLYTRAYLYHNNKETVHQHVDSILETLQMTEYEDQLYGELSGGQRRRADIARALIHSPEILFLDEPTTGLDPSTRKLIWKTLDTLREKGLTIILTTHYMEETISCDKVIIMNKGDIITVDTPEQLRLHHSHDQLKVMGQLDRIKQQLTDYEYVEHQEYLSITVNKSDQTIDLLHSIKDFVEAFEVIRGNMDDVFLNLTGTRLE